MHALPYYTDVSSQVYSPTSLPYGEGHGSHQTRGWVGHRANPPFKKKTEDPL